MNRNFLYFILFAVVGNLFFVPLSAQTAIGIEMKSESLVAYQHPLKYKVNRGISKIPGVSITANQFNQQVLDYINEMRRDPKAFYDQYVEKYIKEKNARFTTTYTHSLKKVMLHSPALTTFKVSTDLEKTALLQLNYLSKFGGHKLTHEQGKIGFAERMKNAGLHCLAENLYTDDNPEPLAVVIDLLIDQHVPSFGHRKNLMNPIYTEIGIVHGKPKGGRTIVVMDFGCKK